MDKYFIDVSLSIIALYVKMLMSAYLCPHVSFGYPLMHFCV